MSKWLKYLAAVGLVTLVVAGLIYAKFVAESYKTNGAYTFNPFTNKLDYYNSTSGSTSDTVASSTYNTPVVTPSSSLYGFWGKTGLFSSSTLFVDATSTFSGAIMASGTTGVTPGSGPGTRFMYIPSKGGALRAGVADGTNWDPSNIGYASVAFGEFTKASGANSVAFPYYNECTGARCTAIGSGSSASGNDATAIGQNNSAIGSGSLAFGRANTAYGNFSVAGGYQNYAEGVGATSLGAGGYLQGNYSVLFGLNPNYLPFNKTLAFSNTFAVLGGNSTFGTSTLASHVLTVSATSTSGGVMLIKGINGLTAPFLQIQDSAGADKFLVNSSGQVGVGTSTPRSIFHVEDNTQTTTTQWVGSLSRPGVTCFGDTDGVGATCAYFNDGLAYYYSTSTY